MLFNNRVIHLSLASIFLFAHDSTAQQQCPRGAFVETGKKCPCLSVDTGCKIVDTDSAFDDVRGMSCGKLEVTTDSNGDYPNIEVEYSWEMCNKNSFDIKLKQDFAKFFDWTKRKGSKDENINNPRFPLGGKTLEAGACLNQSQVVTLDTANRYTIATQLEGFVVKESGGIVNPQNSYCYAFSNESVSFKKGKCNVTTDAACMVEGTTTSCQDFIDQARVAGRCADFNASFTWKACNYQPYDMKIFSDASNVKIATKNNGLTINVPIANVQGPIGSGECEKFGPKTKIINTCSDDEKLFYSINLQGSKQNEKFWHECQDFTFKKLQRFREPILKAPSKAPSAPSKGKGKGNGRNTLSKRKRRATRRNL